MPEHVRLGLGTAEVLPGGRACDAARRTPARMRPGSKMRSSRSCDVQRTTRPAHPHRAATRRPRGAASAGLASATSHPMAPQRRPAGRCRGRCSSGLARTSGSTGSRPSCSGCNTPRRNTQHATCNAACCTARHTNAAGDGRRCNARNRPHAATSCSRPVQFWTAKKIYIYLYI
jgi:hypothetical protein